MVTRQAAAAGRFYPADRQTLYSEVNHLLQQATTNPCKNLAAIIVLMPDTSSQGKWLQRHFI